MSVQGIDYSWTHVALPAGCKFVARYYSHDPSKDLTLYEARLLKGKGQQLISVWEQGGQRADGGRPAGLADAKAAMVKAASCHQPAGSCIYFAVDWDTTVGPLITAYFKATREVLGSHYRVGAYGGIQVIKGLFDKHLIDFGWQTYAWSGGRWDHRAQVQQYDNSPGSYDRDRAMVAGYGQWQPDTRPVPPISHPDLCDGTGRGPFRKGDRGSTVAMLQHWLNKVGAASDHIAEDGDFGQATVDRVKQFQSHRNRAGEFDPPNHMIVDGCVGPHTWRSMCLAARAA